MKLQNICSNEIVRALILLHRFSKNIGEAFLKHKELDEKLALSKTVKRNSSKKLLQSVKVSRDRFISNFEIASYKNLEMECSELLKFLIYRNKCSSI